MACVTLDGSQPFVGSWLKVVWLNVLPQIFLSLEIILHLAYFTVYIISYLTKDSRGPQFMEKFPCVSPSSLYSAPKFPLHRHLFHLLAERLPGSVCVPLVSHGFITAERQKCGVIIGLALFFSFFSGISVKYYPPSSN